MRALIHDAFGEPEEVLHIADRPVPEPGPGQIRLRVRYSPIHNHDIWTIRGSYGFQPELPAPAGTEVFGIVDKLGEGVTGIELDQRGVSGSSFGIWAEYAIVDAAGFIPVPDQLSDETASQLVSMPFSAISLLDFLNVAEGEWIVQNSANGAIGRMVAQLARARGLHVLGLVRRDAGIEELKNQGIGDVVSTADPEWRDQAEKITGGAPIRAGVDSVGGEAAGQILSLLAEEGTLVSFGAMGSPTLEISSWDLIFRDLSVKGFWGAKVNREMEDSKKQALFAELMQYIGTGKLTLPVSGIFDAADIEEAIDAHFTPGRVGKVLLKF